ncbi:MAG: T9SS type A sorting domain-containing protein [Bacteroidia bacterium]|nr:T9SS type A sorting domain-containing protein [Bacteroidia bacterium]
MKKNYIPNVTIGFFCMMVMLFTGAKAQTASALYFDGIDDHVITPTINFSSSDKMTIEAWVKPINITTNTYYTITRQNTGNSTTQWLLSFQNNGAFLSFGLNTTSGYTELDVPITATNYVNGWHHIAAVYDGAIKQIYVDGVVIGTETHTGNVVAPGTDQMIGTAPFIPEYFNGYIDEVRYWNVARTQCEIRTYMNAEIPANAPGLIFNYHFNQGVASGSNSGVTTPTSAAAVGNGTIVNFALTGTISNWVTPGAVPNDYTTTIAPPIVGPNVSNTIVCLGTPVTLSGTGADSYTWTGGVTDGVPFTPNTTDTYTVVGSNTTTTCSDTAMATINILALPVLSVTASSNLVCAGSTVALTASGANTFTWTGGITNAQAFTINTTNSYSVTGTDTVTGCTNTVAIAETITVNPLPFISIVSSNSLLCLGEAVTFTTVGASTSYTWSSSSNASVITATPAASGDYTVSVQGTDVNNCSNSTTYTQTVSECTGISSLSENRASLNMYPNPADNVLTISSATNKTFSLVNEFGQTVKTLTAGQNDISDVPTGIYILMGEHEGQLIKQKLVLTR